jgi:large subunit ribosomal protein L18
MMISRNKLRLHRKKRIRAKIAKGGEKIRLTVFRSLTGFYAQAIDDATGKTLVASNSKMAKAKNDIEGAGLVGKDIAKKCVAKKITEVAFDRSGYKYHGKAKAFAEGAREGGLKF